jgi:hypothetical protein
MFREMGVRSSLSAEIGRRRPAAWLGQRALAVGTPRWRAVSPGKKGTWGCSGENGSTSRIRKEQVRSAVRRGLTANMLKFVSGALLSASVKV